MGKREDIILLSFREFEATCRLTFWSRCAVLYQRHWPRKHPGWYLFVAQCTWKHVGLPLLRNQDASAGSWCSHTHSFLLKCYQAWNSLFFLKSANCSVLHCSEFYCFLFCWFVFDTWWFCHRRKIICSSESALLLLGFCFHDKKVLHPLWKWQLINI